MTKNIRDANRDSFDFRDLIYQPALLDLADELHPQWDRLHILDQKKEGACTGFGLAAAVNYLLALRGNADKVSARMLFEVAKRYDEWPGEKYDYSSPRGAMKGWYKHGVCSEKLWPNHAAKNKSNYLTLERQSGALKYPLGAYYRVLPRRNDVHAALNEVGVVYAAADTHDGWDEAFGKGEIPFSAGATGGGGHAFAIVGYTGKGFLVQNSWGDDWGGFRDADGKLRRGVALWHYEDFDLNAWDLWVARTALPIDAAGGRLQRYTHAPAGSRVTTAGPPAHEIWNHYVHIDDGQYDPKGDYPSHREEVEAIVRRLLEGEGGVKPRHVLLYAHGGLNSIDACSRRVSKWRPVFKANGVAEIHFIWETGFLAELRDVLLGKEKLARERVAGVSDWWDRFIEKSTQPIGYPLWQEMRSDAEVAFSSSKSAGQHFLNTLQTELAKSTKPPQLHLAAHSAGSIWSGHLLDYWKKIGGTAFANLIFFAPACTSEFFLGKIAPALASGSIKKMHHFLLDDERELDDNVAQIYRKSLLYLVSRVYQNRRSVEPILGMEKYLVDVMAELKKQKIDKLVANYTPRDHADLTRSKSHGGFDNDEATMNAMLEIVLGKKPATLFTKKELEGY